MFIAGVMFIGPDCWQHRAWIITGVRKLYEAFSAIVMEADLRPRLNAFGMEPVGRTPSKLKALIG